MLPLPQKKDCFPLPASSSLSCLPCGSYTYLKNYLKNNAKNETLFPNANIRVVFGGLLHLIYVAIWIINDLPASLLSSVSCFLYADDLTICSSFLPISTASEAPQGALISLEHWSEYLCFPLNPGKCDAFFSVDPCQANLQPNLLLFNSRLRFNSTPTLLGVT